MSSNELMLLENPLFKDVIAALTEAKVADTVMIKILEMLRKAVKQQSDASLSEEIEKLKEQILAKDKELEDKDAELTKKDEDKEADLGKKDEEVTELKTKNEGLEGVITEIRQNEVNVLLAQIKALDKEYDEKDLLEGIDDLCTQKKLLTNVFRSVTKLAAKTDLKVGDTSQIEGTVNTFLGEEMGITNVKEFIEG